LIWSEALGCLHIHVPGVIFVRRLDGEVVSVYIVNMLYRFSKFPRVPEVRGSSPMKSKKKK
jgi:hypothetical protein